jgi:hypothetical protein
MTQTRKRLVLGSLLTFSLGLFCIAAQAQQPTGTTLDEDAKSLRKQLQDCWFTAAAALTVVTLEIHLKPDGTLDGDPVVLNDPESRGDREAAIDAVKRCQPFRFSEANYTQFKVMEVSFDPRTQQKQ